MAIHHLNILVLVGATSFLLLENVTEGCTCRKLHPQDHFCSDDFVALVKVKGFGKNDGRHVSYHVKVKKEFKMTHKAREALSHGFLWTSPYESSCGVFLGRSKYVITGYVNGEKALTSLCGYVKEWTTLSRKQRKGFRKLYQHGCRCRVLSSFQSRLFGKGLLSEKGRYCPWITVWDGDKDCEGLHSVCVPDNDTCRWLPNRVYKRCMKQRQKQLDTERRREP
ncbi:tissue inhibitor of metalloproteinase-like [Tachypleus tridentatus]|uniref:tissue inhibitor of metalloproteinase-like n=1 Tax=Tachypleus tridentatus TaxID=6853 RepID=UPI003FD1EC7C